MRYLDKLEEAKVDKDKPYGEKTRARSRRNFNRAYQHASDTGEGDVGKMIRSKKSRKIAVDAARARRQAGQGDRPLQRIVNVEKELKAEAYIQLGEIIAETVQELALQDIHNNTARQMRAGRYVNPKTNRRKRRGPNRGRRATDQDLAESKAGDRYKKQQGVKTIISNINANSAQADAAMPKPDPKPGVKARLVSGLVRAARSIRKKITGSGLTRREAQVADKLRTRANADYRSAEDLEAGGGSEESVAMRSRRAHKDWEKAQKIEGRDK